MSPREQLNCTEIRITTLVWQGRTNPEIAGVVGTSEQVIKNHLRNIFDKARRREPTGACFVRRFSRGNPMGRAVRRGIRSCSVNRRSFSRGCQLS